MAKRTSDLTFTGMRPNSTAAAPNPSLQSTGQPMTPYDNATKPYVLRGTVPVPGLETGPGGPANGFPGVAGWGG